MNLRFQIKNIFDTTSKFSKKPDPLLKFFCVFFPVLLLLVKKWMNTCLFVAAALSTLVIVYRRNQFTFKLSSNFIWFWALSFVFLAPVFGGFFAQCLRNEVNIGHLDNLSKFLFAFPVFIYLKSVNFNPLRYFEWIIPATVYLTGLFVWFYPDLSWGANRVTTYFVDPQSFSSLALILGFWCLSLIDMHAKDSLYVRIFKVCAFLLGLYLSFITVSRAGWLAIPFALALWLKVRGHQPLWLVTVLVSVIVTLILFMFPLVTEKLWRAVDEIMSYSWVGVNRLTSVEERFAFFRMAWELFKLHPIAGWGDKGFADAVNLPQIIEFTAESTRLYPLDHGFHNEFFTQMVRSGLMGVVPTLALFLIPTALFIKAIWHKDHIIQSYGVMAMNYYLVVLVTSISTEVFNIKFVSAFHAMTLAVYCAVIIRHLYPQPQTAHES